MIRRVVLGLGSNLGDREANIRSAIEALGEIPSVVVRATSSNHETEAVGPPQPNYLNAAVLLETALSARALLEQTLRIERALGRTRPDAIRWGPRTIDIDLLWIDGEVVLEPELQIPHPRLHERSFALRPMLEVAPNAIDPHSQERYADMSLEVLV